MPRILIVECMQEISSFNPVPSGYESFHVERGEELYRAAGPQHSDRRRARGLRGAQRHHDRAGLRRPRRAAPVCCRPKAGRGFRASSSTAVEANLRGHRRHLRVASRRDGRRGRARSRGLSPHRNPPHGRPGDSDRHLARPARHPHRPHAAAGRRAGDLPHLSARGLRRHRRARRPASPQASRRRCPAGDRPRRRSRRWSAATSSSPRSAATATSSANASASSGRQRAGRRHHDRQSRSPMCRNCAARSSS